MPEFDPQLDPSAVEEHRPQPDEIGKQLAAEFGGLVRLAYAIRGDRSVAEESAAEAIARVWQRAQAGDVGDALHYLRRTLVNTAVRAERRAWLESKLLRREARAVEVEDSAASLVERVDVGRALMQLPPAQRAVIALRYLEDRSEADIAALLKISSGTVKSRSARGLAALRAALEGGRDGSRN